MRYILFTLVLLLISCYMTNRKTGWRERSFYHSGPHWAIENRRWDTTITLFSGQKLNMTAVETKCNYRGCPAKDTFYLIRDGK